MINIGKRGEPVWKRATWDEALGVIAGKLQAIREKHGPEAVALFSHGTGGAFWKHLLKAYGSGNYTAPSFAQCRGPRDVGFTLTFGADVGSPEYYDFSESRHIVLIGSHLGENAHNSQVQDFVQGLSKGARLTVVDPRLSNIASKADHWLAIKPATDLALLLAWIRLIVNEELYDADYLKAYATGLPELKSAVREYTPEWAARETDLPGGYHRLGGPGAGRRANPTSSFPGPLHRLVRRRCPAQPRHRHPERPPRCLGPARRDLSPRRRSVPEYRGFRSTRAPGRSSRTGRGLSVRRVADHDLHPARIDHRETPTRSRAGWSTAAT